MTAVGNARTEAGTADELLNVAERLFAERGVENVALTQIVAASGQKNRSALHYHFGSRDGVLTAVLNRRLGPINARREALLSALPAAAGPIEVLRAMIGGLGEIAIEEPWGPDYLSILAQVMFHPQLLGGRAVEEAGLSGMRRGRRRLIEAVGRPEALLAQRMAWLTDSVVFALARWVQDTPPANRTPAGMAALIHQLATYGVGGLSAPDPTPET